MSDEDIAQSMSDNLPDIKLICKQLRQADLNIGPLVLGPFNSIHSLDSLGIYGKRIGVLLQNVCAGNIYKMVLVLRAEQYSFVDSGSLNQAMDNKWSGFNLETIIESMRKEFPQFKPETLPEIKHPETKTFIRRLIERMPSLFKRKGVPA
jgi:hypothetical protein